MLFKKIDRWLLQCFECGSNALTRLTGKNNYFWARIVLFLSTVMAFFVVKTSTSGYNKFSPFFIVIFSLSIAEIYWLERISLNKISPDIANPLKADGFYLRIILGLFSLGLSCLLIPFFVLLGLTSIVNSSDPVLICGLWLYQGSLWILAYLISCDTKSAAITVSFKSEG